MKMLKTRKYNTLTPNNVVNLFLLYKLDLWPSDLNTGFTLGGCMFWGVWGVVAMLLDSIPVDIILYLTVE